MVYLCIYFGTKPTRRTANDSRHRCMHSSISRLPPFVPSHLAALGHVYHSHSHEPSPRLAGEALPGVSMRRVGVGWFVRRPSPLCAPRPISVPLRAVSADPNRTPLHATPANRPAAGGKGTAPTARAPRRCRSGTPPRYFAPWRRRLARLVHPRPRPRSTLAPPQRAGPRPTSPLTVRMSKRNSSHTHTRIRQEQHPRTKPRTNPPTHSTPVEGGATTVR